MTIPERETLHSDLTWACVEDGFHVASTRGAFLGYIDRQPDGLFLACDMYSRPIASFPDLSAAMAAVGDQGATTGDGR